MNTMSSDESAAAAFPTDTSVFDSDDRISFSKLDGKFVLVNEDGSEYEFDDAIKRWIPVLDEALLEEQQRAYRMSDVDEEAPVESGRRKRKAAYVNGEDVSEPFGLYPLVHVPS
jgi:HIV Tat-specific factor 1